MNEQEMIKFVQWLPENVEEFKGKTPEECVKMLNKISSQEGGEETITSLVEQYKAVNTNMFKKGGKLDFLVNKFQRGGRAERLRARGLYEKADAVELRAQNRQARRDARQIDIDNEATSPLSLYKQSADFDRDVYRDEKRAIRETLGHNHYDRAALRNLAAERIMNRNIPVTMQRFESPIEKIEVQHAPINTEFDFSSFEDEGGVPEFVGSFNQAFGAARKAGLNEFTWRGKRYGTSLAETPTPKPTPVTPAPIVNSQYPTPSMYAKAKALRAAQEAAVGTAPAPFTNPEAGMVVPSGVQVPTPVTPASSSVRTTTAPPYYDGTHEPYNNLMHNYITPDGNTPTEYTPNDRTFMPTMNEVYRLWGSREGRSRLKSDYPEIYDKMIHSNGNPSVKDMQSMGLSSTPQFTSITGGNTSQSSTPPPSYYGYFTRNNPFPSRQETLELARRASENLRDGGVLKAWDGDKLKVPPYDDLVSPVLRQKRKIRIEGTPRYLTEDVYTEYDTPGLIRRSEVGSNKYPILRSDTTFHMYDPKNNISTRLSQEDGKWTGTWYMSGDGSGYSEEDARKFSILFRRMLDEAGAEYRNPYEVD